MPWKRGTLKGKYIPDPKRPGYEIFVPAEKEEKNGS